MRKIILNILLICVCYNIYATNYNGNPSSYQSFISQLQAGDTLFLAAGNYTGRMNLDDIVGTETAPIVIQGPEGTNSAVFLGNACCNTISLERCAFLEIRNLTIDGQNIPFIDAVKAEGTNGNWTHHITLENLLVINHGGAALTTGINTKCVSWDWVIRKNTFIEPGLGMYLGNSDGNGPFINGLIEYNLILNPIRYGLQIKHQNEGQRNIEGMTLDGKTIIRYNVISREEGFDPDTPRPNLLVGNFPASGPGENDYYEIYGNFLWQNPNEGLFQGTGNIAFYNNLLVNHQPNGWGIFSFPHNGFNPRNIYYFNNTILSASEGIEINNQNPAFTQMVIGNAIFADTPLDIGSVAETDNITETLIGANSFLISPNNGLTTLDLTPRDKMLSGTEIDFTDFTGFTDYDIDFDGVERGWEFRGAYASEGPPLWVLGLVMRPELEDMTSSILNFFSPNRKKLKVFPNPNNGSFEIELNNEKNGDFNIKLYRLDGSLVYHKTQNFNRNARVDYDINGFYILKIEGNEMVWTEKVIIE
jgi:hypothetical protein